MKGWNEGHEQGKADSDASKQRDPTPPLVKAVVSEQYRREYSEGYRAGYDDKEFKKA